MNGGTRPLLTVAYDGTNYAGWQVQANALSVQQVLETALTKLFGAPAKVRGGGRTDAGVHALGQRALVMEPYCEHIPIDKLHLAVNAFLPADIRALAAEAVPEAFCPIRSAISKTYVYSIYNAMVTPPTYRLYAASVTAPLDDGAMREAAKHFLGEHDFIGFSSTGGSAATSVRTLYALNIAREGDLVNMTITGSGFLYNMVRIIAGTLVLCGRGKFQPDAVPELIASRDRNRAGATMPAHGLLLKEIRYK